MQYFGTSGYRDLAAPTMQAFASLRDDVQAMPELCVLGNPGGPLMADKGDAATLRKNRVPDAASRSVRWRLRPAHPRHSNFFTQW